MLNVNELLKATKGRLISGKKNCAVKGISIDTRTIRKDEAFIALRGDNFDGHNFVGAAIKKGSSCIICGPGKAKSAEKAIAFIEVKDTVLALGDIARFKREKFGLPVIAVTGSNGKTTAKEMIAWVLSKKYKVLKNEGTKNNRIGLPMTLLNLDGSFDLAVLEVGTNHFGEVNYLADICRPNIGVITNIGPSHLECFEDLSGVLREKTSLLKHLKRPCIAILNNDDKMLRESSKKEKNALIFSTGLKNKGDFCASGITRRPSFKLEFLLNRKYRFVLNTLGAYNIYNALTAIALARILGMGYYDISNRLSSFNFPKARLNFIEVNKIKFIDDTYNSNPLSLKEALETLEKLETGGRKILVMGDMMELGRHKHLFHKQAVKKAAKVCDTIITVGKLSCLAAESLRDFGFDIRKIFACQSSQEAREALLSRVSPKKNDVVLVKGSRAMKMEEVFKV
ncbi:MAG: UDP-N-acetylmuramoyl-tripeptide--D-alanyl-D-alanine ligase [Candidatus Omnitrophota bacterium]